MLSASDFRNGATFEWDGDVYQVLDFQHVKPGKGAAFVRATIRSVLSGATKELTFNPTEKFNDAQLETKEMQYLYNDDALYYFMDNETYEQLPLNKDEVQEAIQFLRENDTAVIRFYKGKAFSVQAPNFVELEVTQTEPGVKGNTTTGATKPATVETGFTLNVPLFVNIGDRIKIDTRSGEYLSRV
ncbi:elongation factor P [uncultured Fenollaria sp.]|uniref:elongation factor P n=1 Tax=uncultured Fenollaria sp. TaxID=1686315 RepID=UPI0025CBE6F9|nr:elongation factor P [uncultured Fenollaria sp.]